MPGPGRAAVRARGLFAADGRRRALARVLAAVLVSDDFVFLSGRDDDARARVLDLAAPELAGLGCRVVRVSAAAPGGLGLPGLVAQVAGRPGTEAPTDDDLELCHRALTGVDGGCGRVALLVDGAHGLRPAAIRYIQLACRSEPGLRVVFAGEPAFAAALAGDEFAHLRRRLACRIVLPGDAGGGIRGTGPVMAASGGEAGAEPVTATATATIASRTGL